MSAGTLLRLARGAGDHVHADAGVRHALPDAGHPFSVQRGVVAPPHALQDGVAAACRGMWKWAKRRWRPRGR